MDLEDVMDLNSSNSILLNFKIDHQLLNKRFLIPIIA